MNWPKKTLIRIYIELCMSYGKTYVHPINLGVIYIFICPPCCLYKILKNKKDSVDGTQLAATLLLWFHQTDNRIYRSISSKLSISSHILLWPSWQQVVWRKATFLSILFLIIASLYRSIWLHCSGRTQNVSSQSQPPCML